MKLFEEINFSSSHIFVIDMQRPCLEREYRGLKPEVYKQMKEQALQNISNIMGRSKANILVETVYLNYEKTIPEIKNAGNSISHIILQKIGIPLLPENRRDTRVEECYIKAKRHITDILEKGDIIDLVGGYTGRCVLSTALSIVREFPEHEPQIRIIPDGTIPATIGVDGTSEDAHSIREFIPKMYKRRKRLLDYYGLS